MNDLFVLAKDIGSVVSLVISIGVLFSALYSMLRGTPRLIRKLTGVEELENSIDELQDTIEKRSEMSDETTESLLNSVQMSQQLQLQQAKEFNRLSAMFYTAIETDDDERPYLSPQKIRRLLLEDNTPDFTDNEEDE